MYAYVQPCRLNRQFGDFATSVIHATDTTFVFLSPKSCQKAISSGTARLSAKIRFVFPAECASAMS